MLFQTGSRLEVSPAAVDAFLGEDFEAAGSAVDLVRAHQNGDWGAVDDVRRQLNQRALQMGGQLISVFILPTTQARVLIVTNREADYTHIMREYEWMP